MNPSAMAAFHHLKISHEYMMDFIRSDPRSKGAIMFSIYSKKVDWIIKHIITDPSIPDRTRMKFKDEMQSDVLAIAELNSKLSLLTPDQRNFIEVVLENLLKGEEIHVTLNEQ